MGHWLQELSRRFRRREDPARDGASSHLLVGWLFLRLLGLVYLIAFASLWVQIHGLVGDDGMLPACDLLEAARSQLGADAYRRLPTLGWFGCGDLALHALCAAGVLLSLFLIAGLAPLAVSFLLWVHYLSLAVLGQVFLSFQWDALLLETGLLALFLAPAQLRTRPLREAAFSTAGVWLLRCLLFKLMFLSGVTKLLSGDGTWRGLTALAVHFETTPLPTWVGWFAHQLPAWFQQIAVVVMFTIEIGVPFLIFAPRRFRQLAALALLLFQLLIAATGNYGFFNLLAVVLCVPLLDDRLMLRAVPRRWLAWAGRPAPRAAPRGWRRGVGWALAGSLLFVSGLSLVREMALTQRPRRLPAPVAVFLTGCAGQLEAWGQPYILGPLQPLRSINGYGLFRTMTTERPEIVIQGSRDGSSWQSYAFRWKPGDLERRPGFVAPHQPRLDWQMWFAALNPKRSEYWLERLARRLLEGSPHVVGLLAGDPFAGEPPRFVRYHYYRYEFSDWQSWRRTGAWWRRVDLGPLSQAMSRPPAADRPDTAQPST